MPKLKTNSSAKKRFSITSKGHISRGQVGHRHKFVSKTSKQKLHLKFKVLVTKSHKQIIKSLLPYGK